jgi:hypothetical protein
MSKQRWISGAIVAGLLGVITLFAYHRWSGNDSTKRAELLAMMPADAGAVMYLDVAELRSSPFLSQLYQWAPHPQADTDYAQFVHDTGFDFERDLDRVAIAWKRRSNDSALFAVADGRFDQKKISAYSAKYGSATKHNGQQVFSVQASGAGGQISFTLLGGSRIAIANDADIAPHLESKNNVVDTAEWRSRFERLAGSPIFAVIRQDAGAGSTFAAQAPGGLRSPQLAALLDQLQWITLAGKPESDSLRVVAEGECTVESTARQLADMLNGIVFLAQAGLNDAKTRQQLDPAAREAYLELLKSADVSKLDRGETKSVRLVFEVTPKFLRVARTAVPAPSAINALPSTPQKHPAGKTADRK